MIPNSQQDENASLRQTRAVALTTAAEMGVTAANIREEWEGKES